MELKSANDDGEDYRNDETANPSPCGNLFFWLAWIFDFSFEFTNRLSFKDIVEFQSGVLESTIDYWTIAGEF